MEIAVIGGGINGIMTAWELCKRDHEVTVFEKNVLMAQTSSASTKLLHGGLRYLENFEFRLVKEGLRERKWWIENAPHLAHPIKIYIPIYRDSRRPSWAYKAGLFLYDLLAGSDNLEKHRSCSTDEIITNCPELKVENLIKGFAYFDGQMDDYELGMWAVKQAQKTQKLTIFENTAVEKVSIHGEIFYNNQKKQQFNKIINVAGPWAEKLLTVSNITHKYRLDLIRGAHIVIDRKLNDGYLLEVPDEKRIFFVLPYQKKTLIGTTEYRQSLSDHIILDKNEVEYLLTAYNHYFKRAISIKDITKSFAGLRPLIKSANNPNKATREYAVQTNNKLITVFGGKWTTSRQLAKKVVGLVS